MSVPQTDLAEINGGQPDLKPSIWALLEGGTAINPEQIALISMHQEASHLSALVGSNSLQQSEHLTLTYAQLRQGAVRLASILRRQGIEPGSILMTIIPNCAEWCLFSWAAALMELTLVPLDVRIVEGARKEELRYHLETLKPTAIVVSDTIAAVAVTMLLKELDLEPKLCMTLSSEKPTNSCWTALSSLSNSPVSEDSMDYPATTSDPSRVATVIFTSGTSSGIPKGCPHTPTTLLNSAHNNASFGSITSSTKTILHYQNFRIIMTILCLSHWQHGATTIMPSKSFTAASTLDAIEAYRATSMLCMPPMVYAMAEHKDFSPLRVISLRQVSVAGDVITTPLLEFVKQLFPESRVFNQHGMTECSGILGWPSMAIETGGTPSPSSSSPPAYSGIASVGRVLPGSKLRILSDSNPNHLANRNQIGELHIGGLSVITYYVGDVKPELFYTDKTGTNWLVTGDRGLVDDEGFVYIVGRSKDIMKRGGVPIAPAGLEACLSMRAGCQVSFAGSCADLLAAFVFSRAVFLLNQVCYPGRRLVLGDHLKLALCDTQGTELTIAL